MHSFSLVSVACLTAFFTTTLAKQAAPIAGFNIAWSETFSGTALDTSNWEYYTDPPSNGEQEVYTTSANNCKITSNNTFLITPQNSGGSWTSCRVSTTGSWQAPTGGKMIVQSRFKLGDAGAQASGTLQGVWPAFWSLGQAMREGVSWPACGELDTFENVNGGKLGAGTVHCGSACNDPTGLTAGIDFDYGSYHTWAHAIDLTESDWQQQTITWYMDGQPYHVVHGSDLGQTAWTAVAHSPMFMILNVAIGGGWPGPVAGNTVDGWASGMEVEYVAVYTSS